MTTAIVLVAACCVLSVPIGVVIGRAIRAADRALEWEVQ